MSLRYVATETVTILLNSALTHNSGNIQVGVRTDGVQEALLKSQFLNEDWRVKMKQVLNAVSKYLMHLICLCLFKMTYFLVCLLWYTAAKGVQGPAKQEAPGLDLCESLRTRDSFFRC